MSNLSKEHVQTMYQRFRATPLDNLQNTDADERLNAVLSSSEKWGSLSPEEQAVWRLSTRLLLRAAHACEESVFVESVGAGEFPPMKLTSQEQEYLKGGGFSLSNVLESAPPSWFDHEQPGIGNTEKPRKFRPLW